MSVPVPRKQYNSKEELENFARRIERHLKNGGESIDRLVCRLLTGKDAKVAAHLAGKWVEWRYGKATERHEIEQRIKVEMTIEDADRLISNYFQSLEPAAIRAIEVGGGDQN